MNDDAETGADEEGGDAGDDGGNLDIGIGAF